MEIWDNGIEKQFSNVLPFQPCILPHTIEEGDNERKDY